MSCVVVLIATNLFGDVTGEEKKYILDSFKNVNDWSRENLAPRLLKREKKALLPQSGVYLYLTPDRKLKIDGEIAAGKDPLDHPEKRNVLVKKWRRYSFYPNNFPYLTDHVLLITEANDGQAILDKDKSVMQDVVDLQSVFPESTLSFNHLAGNSLDHFHVHLSPQDLPIAGIIGDKTKFFPNEEFTLADPSVKSLVFDDNACQRGFLFEGEKNRLALSVFRFLNELSTCLGFYYNLILLPVKDGRYRAMVMVRWSPKERPLFVEKLPYKVDPGALELGGLMMIATPVSLTEGKGTDPYLDLNLLDNNLRKNCDFTILAPRDLDRFIKIKQCSNKL